MESIKQTYFQECEELLLAMEEGLLAMKGGEADSEMINAVFRAVHSIKGGGGAFGFEALVGFAHGFETVLDDIRSGKLEPGPEVVGILLRAGDTLADHVAAIREDAPLAPGYGDDISAELAAVAATPAEDAESAAADFEGLDFRPMIVSVAPAAAQSGWHIHFVPHASLYSKANEPALLIRELKALGTIEVSADLTRVPELAAIDPEQAYFSWDIVLSGDIARASVEEVFDFAVDDCELAITEVAAAAPAAAEPEIPPLEDVKREPEKAPSRAEHKDATGQVEHKDAPGQTESAVKQTIRVDLDKLDRLVNLVGELVITQAMLCQRISAADIGRNSLVGNGLAELDHLVRELQESVMAIRTQPVKSVFQRFPRLVRELGAQTNKQVRLVVKGESTEVDKTVIERLGEPLTHMIRNAIDHGLESTDQRLASGKPAEGTVTLSAEHRGGRIIIEVSDDGNGIDRTRVREKALEKGLIQPDAILSDEEIDNLIFLPGFSTASQVSNISGRGVGMDVVRRNITELGGRIQISNVPKKGSRFSFTLPLTLAVLDGMVVSVGGQVFVLPLTHIVESLRPRSEDIKPFGSTRKLLRIRDNYVPLVMIDELLGIEFAPPETRGGVVILVESDITGRFALVVDAIIGQQQVVIKSFEANYERIEGIAGATIMGDGRVALILDVDGLASSFRALTSETVQLQQEPMRDAS